MKNNNLRYFIKFCFSFLKKGWVFDWFKAGLRIRLLKFKFKAEHKNNYMLFVFIKQMDAILLIKMSNI